MISPYPRLPPHPILTFFGYGCGCGKPRLIAILRGAVLGQAGRDIAQGSAGEADYLLLLTQHLGYAPEDKVAPLRAELDEIGYAFTARPGRKPLCQLGATSTGAERTLIREHRSAEATTLAERISAGASSQEPVNGYEIGAMLHALRRKLEQDEYVCAAFRAAG